MKSVLIGVVGLLSLGNALPAVAADLPAKAPAPAAAVTNWTGCYIGVEGGGNFGRTRSVATGAPNPAVAGLPLTGTYDMSGGIAGGTVGCNYQAGLWVFGLEDDFSWTNKRGSASDLPPFPTTAINRYSEDWLDTLRGRIGITLDRALLYGTAGAAFAGTSADVCNPVCVADSKTRTGLVLGLGVEFAALQNVSVKIEYLHADFGSKTYFDPPPASGSVNTRNVSLIDDVVRAGINWRFYAGPVLAKD